MIQQMKKKTLKQNRTIAHSHAKIVKFDTYLQLHKHWERKLIKISGKQI